MYGMINEAMRRHVSETAGADAWDRIAARADSPTTFASMHYYDDALTYSLVAAATEELHASAADLLRSFGRYWTTRVGPENYADILGATGTDVESVLVHLDEMHARLQSLYPELRPPSFEVSSSDGRELELRYRSEREGLEPFVLGLLEGLGELYGTPTTAELVAPRSGVGEADVFRVSIEK